MCVWDIASSAIVTRLDETKCGGHTGIVRDMYSSAFSDTLVTVSYDKTAKVWLNSMSIVTAELGKEEDRRMN